MFYLYGAVVVAVLIAFLLDQLDARRIKREYGHLFQKGTDGKNDK